MQIRLMGAAEMRRVDLSKMIKNHEEPMGAVGDRMSGGGLFLLIIAVCEINEEWVAKGKP